MNATRLLLLYPPGWRARYGDEMADLIVSGRVSARWRLWFDVLRGALDAHLHPEIAPAVMAVAAGGGVHRLDVFDPRARAVLLVFLAACVYALGPRLVFAFDTPTCMAGYNRVNIDAPIGGIYECRAVESAQMPQVYPAGIERREVGVYLTNMSLRIFDLDYVRGTQEFLGVVDVENR